MDKLKAYLYASEQKQEKEKKYLTCFKQIK